eukprot:1881869-Amphidinium_carterae.1
MRKPGKRGIPKVFQVLASMEAEGESVHHHRFNLSTFFCTQSESAAFKCQSGTGSMSSQEFLKRPNRQRRANVQAALHLA